MDCTTRITTIENRQMLASFLLRHTERKKIHWKRYKRLFHINSRCAVEKMKRKGIYCCKMVFCMRFFRNECHFITKAVVTETFSRTISFVKVLLMRLVSKGWGVDSEIEPVLFKQHRNLLTKFHFVAFIRHIQHTIYCSRQCISKQTPYGNEIMH